MFNFFGKKKQEEPKPKPVDLNITSMNLTNTVNDTTLKLRAIESQLREALKVYRAARTPTAKATAKKKATTLLKKKKMYENHINNLSNTQMTVDFANMDCQMMKDNMNMLQVMKDTVQVQKDTLHSMGGIDSMYNIMDDMQDIKEEQQEINEEFQRNYEVDIGDDELDAELDEIDYEMKIEMKGEEMEAPDTRVMSQKEKDEAELENALK